MLDLVGKHTVGFSHEEAHLLRMCESRSTYMYHVFLQRTRFLFFFFILIDALLCCLDLLFWLCLVYYL